MLFAKLLQFIADYIVKLHTKTFQKDLGATGDFILQFPLQICYVKKLLLACYNFFFWIIT